MVPNATWAASNLGCALFRAKDYRRAILWFSRAKQLGYKKQCIDVKLARAKEMIKCKGIKPV